MKPIYAFAAAAVVAAVAAGGEVPVPYRISDMADDVIGLMDALEFETAHVAGISMGGMITQVVGCRHPARLRSLVSVMAATGNPEVPGPTPAALEVLMTPAPRERDAYLDHTVRTQRVLGSPSFSFDEPAVRELAGRGMFSRRVRSGRRQEDAGCDRG